MNTQEVEEMAKCIFDYVDNTHDIDGYVYIEGSHIPDGLKSFSHNHALAEALYNAGYRKVDRDGTKTADLARELIEAKNKIERLKAEKAKLKCEVNDWKQRYMSREKQYFELVRTSTECINAKKAEAVREFAEKLKGEAVDSILNCDGEMMYSDYDFVTTDDIDALLKEYEK